MLCQTNPMHTITPIALWFFKIQFNKVLPPHQVFQVVTLCPCFHTKPTQCLLHSSQMIINCTATGTSGEQYKSSGSSGHSFSQPRVTSSFWGTDTLLGTLSSYTLDHAIPYMWQSFTHSHSNRYNQTSVYLSLISREQLGRQDNMK